MGPYGVPWAPWGPIPPWREQFSSKSLHENLSKINGEYKGNELVKEVINFIEKDKKRPICSPKN